MAEQNGGAQDDQGTAFCSGRPECLLRVTLTMESSRTEKRFNADRAVNHSGESRGTWVPPALRLRRGVRFGCDRCQDGGGGGLNDVQRFDESGLVA